MYAYYKYSSKYFLLYNIKIFSQKIYLFSQTVSLPLKIHINAFFKHVCVIIKENLNAKTAIESLEEKEDEGAALTERWFWHLIS